MSQDHGGPDRLPPQNLDAERSERIRSQERAEVAAHIHDSVLHTLTLIQRSAGDPREVQRLARAQERDLRAWLYEPKADAEQDLAAAVRKAAAEVEDHHGVPIEVVCVGDCPLDERLGAMLQAAREAARRTQCSSQTRQYAIGIHNFENTHKTVPKGNYSGGTLPMGGNASWMFVP